MLRGEIRAREIMDTEASNKMIGRMTTGVAVGRAGREGGAVRTAGVETGKNPELLFREVHIKVFRWGNDEEEGGRGGYRGSSSRRKPWDGDFD